MSSPQFQLSTKWRQSFWKSANARQKSRKGKSDSQQSGQNKPTWKCRVSRILSCINYFHNEPRLNACLSKLTSKRLWIHKTSWGDTTTHIWTTHSAPVKQNAHWVMVSSSLVGLCSQVLLICIKAKSLTGISNLLLDFILPLHSPKNKSKTMSSSLRIMVEIHLKNQIKRHLTMCRCLKTRSSWLQIHIELTQFSLTLKVP